MKKILILTFYYTPDLCAGSFRNTPFVKFLKESIDQDIEIEVITTKPNRYSTYKESAPSIEKYENLTIHRVDIPAHDSGIKDQILSFFVYYRAALKIAKKNKYSLVFASSSRLFTAFLGKKIAKKSNCVLYLDIRDIFVETIEEVLQKNKIIKKIAVYLLRKFVESPTFNYATHINLVSKGFESYFDKFNTKTLSFYTNGIDKMFIGLSQKLDINSSKKIITYAGNIGEGQGLEKVIPPLAKLLGNSYQINIIGDGGSKFKLLESIHKLKIVNVNLISPLSRNELLKHYERSHFLFLHLNDFKAFEKVLPSKIFEYGATNIPIVAGVAGYASAFIKENILNSFVAEPCDSQALGNWILNNTYRTENRIDFVNKYKRENITKEMVKSVLNYI